MDKTVDDNSLRRRKVHGGIRMARSSLRPGALLIATLFLTALSIAGQDKTATRSQAAYANPHLLVDTGWLAEHAEDEGVRVLDVRERDAYAKGHLPGALNLPRSATFDLSGPSGIVGKQEQIEELLEARGVDDSIHVILYDVGRSTAAARVFWTLEHYGHPRVSVLNGGLSRWQAEGRELSKNTPAVDSLPCVLTGKTGKLSTKNSMLAALEESASFVPLDCRSTGEHIGTQVTAKRSGCIPGSVHIEWTRNFVSTENPVYLTAADLRKLYETAGVTKDKKIHAY
jgi:thiosulfate/3-mercaptopyruvate sulfurtransferase